MHGYDMHNAQRRLQSEFHSCPIELVFDVRGLRTGVVEKVMVEIWQLLWQGLCVADHVGELLGHLGRVRFVVVNAQSLITLALVSKQTLQCRLLQELIHLFVQA